jgi:hypothetical protein
MNRQRLSLAIFLTVGLAGTARADVIPLPPEAIACISLTVGGACTYNGPGTCQNATCTTGTTQSSCVKCVPTEPSKDSGCSIGGRLARTVGPWLAAGLFAAAMMLTRRRPPR